MAKNRALRKNGTVGKLLWCSDREPEAEALRARDAQLLETMAAMVEEVYESDLTVFESGGDGL